MKYRIAAPLLLAATAAWSYDLDCDGNWCKLTCDNGQYAGSLHKTDSGKWTDGQTTSKDKKEVIRQMLKAKGPDCR